MKWVILVNCCNLVVSIERNRVGCSEVDVWSKVGCAGLVSILINRADYSGPENRMCSNRMYSTTLETFIIPCIFCDCHENYASIQLIF